MTPKEKAKDLVDRYLNAPFNCKGCGMPYCDIPCTTLSLAAAKICALIAVDEILDVIVDIYKTYEERKYWQEVKKEIEKL